MLSRTRSFLLLFGFCLTCLAVGTWAQTRLPAFPSHQYLHLKSVLLSPSGDGIWNELQGRLVPVLRLTVISAEPADEPKVIQLAPSAEAEAEVTLLVSRSPRVPVLRGREILFEGVAGELVKVPFHLTLADGSVIRPERPKVTIIVEPSSIERGQSVLLRWASRGADSATLSPDVGAVRLSGGKEFSPTQTTSYTLTARGLGGSTTASTTVTVRPARK